MASEPSKLAAALAKVQAELKPVARNVEGQVGNRKRRYADLAALERAAFPLLGRNGLAFMCRPTMLDGQFVLAYSLIHESGEHEDGIYPMPDRGTSQDIGSAITYARRYAFGAITGAVAEGEDDDAADGKEFHMDRTRPGHRQALNVDDYRELAEDGPQDPARLRDLWAEVRRAGLTREPIQDEHGETVTLGEFIARKGREAIPARPVDQLPRNQDGTLSRSATTDAEKDAAGVMTQAQQKEHTALKNGADRKLPKTEQAKVKRTTAPDLTDPWAIGPPEERPGTIGPNLGKVQALFARWFTSDEREQRLKTAEQVIDRTLTGPKDGRSFSNLSLAEYHKLEGTLGDVKTRDELVARMAEKAAAQ